MKGLQLNPTTWVGTEKSEFWVWRFIGVSSQSKHLYCSIVSLICILKTFEPDSRLTFRWTRSFTTLSYQHPDNFATQNYIAVNPFGELALVQSLWTCISLMQARVFSCFVLLMAAAFWFPTSTCGSGRKKQCEKYTCLTSNLTFNKIS